MRSHKMMSSRLDRSKHKIQKKNYTRFREFYFKFTSKKYLNEFSDCILPLSSSLISPSDQPLKTYQNMKILKALSSVRQDLVWRSTI